MTPAPPAPGAEAEPDAGAGVEALADGTARRGANGQDSVPSERDDERLGDLVERVRHNLLHLVAHLPGPPRALRLRAGDVSVDVEWARDAPEGVVARSGTGGTGPTAPVEQQADADAPGDTPPVRYVTAPTVGTFFRAPEPGAAPFVSEGEVVVAGQQVGIVEVMKLMVAVNAEVPGRVVEVLKANGEPVEFGEPLVALVDEASDGT